MSMSYIPFTQQMNTNMQRGAGYLISNQIICPLHNFYHFSSFAHFSALHSKIWGFGKFLENIKAMVGK